MSPAGSENSGGWCSRGGSDLRGAGISTVSCSAMQATICLCVTAIIQIEIARTDFCFLQGSLRGVRWIYTVCAPGVAKL